MHLPKLEMEVLLEALVECIDTIEIGEPVMSDNQGLMLYADTGELILEDSADFFRMAGPGDGHVVVVDIETGQERARVPIGASATMGMFLCPGFGRDFYVASGWGPVARIFVQ